MQAHISKLFTNYFYYICIYFQINPKYNQNGYTLSTFCAFFRPMTNFRPGWTNFQPTAKFPVKFTVELPRALTLTAYIYRVGGDFSRMLPGALTLGGKLFACSRLRFASDDFYSFFYCRYWHLFSHLAFYALQIVLLLLICRATCPPFNYFVLLDTFTHIMFNVA